MLQYLLNTLYTVLGLIGLFLAHKWFSTLHYKRMGVSFMRMSWLLDLPRTIY